MALLGQRLSKDPNEQKPSRGILPAGHESRSWFMGLSPEKRVAIRELYRPHPSRNGVIIIFVALWAGACILILRFPFWPLRLLGYVVIATVLHSLAIMGHEAIHGNLFRHRALDRWSAFLLGAPYLASATAYKVTHLLHHRYNRGALDPEELSNYIQDRKLLSIAFYVWIFFGALIFLLHLPLNGLRRGTPRERVAIMVDYGLLAALYSSIILLAARFEALSMLVHVWFLPMIFAFMLANLRNMAEHMLTRPGHPLTQTRTVISNRVVRFLMLNQNYHLEHHLFPGVPWYNLPRLHALLQDEYQAAGASVYNSYLMFLWDAVRMGIHGLAPPAPAHQPSRMA